jgi:hypothetical protein
MTNCVERSGATMPPSPDTTSDHDRDKLHEPLAELVGSARAAPRPMAARADRAASGRANDRF